MVTCILYCIYNCLQCLIKIYHMNSFKLSSVTHIHYFSDCFPRFQIFPANSWLNTFGATICSAFTVTMCMTPFDVVSTRMYNQGIDKHGNGLHYKNVVDCFVKIFRTEGLWGFYKGWGPSFLRLGPHTVLSLTIWDRLTVFHKNFQMNKVIKS